MIDKRLGVVMTAETKKALRRYARAQGRTMSRAATILIQVALTGHGYFDARTGMATMRGAEDDADSEI